MNSVPYQYMLFNMFMYAASPHIFLQFAIETAWHKLTQQGCTKCILQPMSSSTLLPMLCV